MQYGSIFSINANEFKKIIQFIPELDAGGAETVVKDYAIELHRQGYNVEVMVLLSNPNAANEKTIRNAGIPIVSLANSNQQVGQHKIFEILHKINRDIEIRKNLKSTFMKTTLQFYMFI